MKKLVFICLVAQILTANEPQELEFSNEYERLNEQLKNSPLSDADTFKYARSADKLGKYKEALNAYAFLLKKEPNNDRLKLEIAQILEKIGNTSEAAALYSEVLKNPNLPNEVKININLKLSALSGQKSPHSLGGLLGVGYGFDSNANNAATADYIYFGAAKHKNERKSDHLNEAFSALNHSYKFSDTLTLDSQIVGFTQNYRKLKENDVGLLLFGSGLTNYGDRYKFYGGVEANRIWLDDSGYLNTYSLIFKLDYKINEKIISKSKLRVSKKSFISSDDKYKDALNYALETALGYDSDTFGVTTLGLFFSRENKLKGEAHPNVDYGSLGVKLQNLYQITPKTTLITSAEYHNEQYKAENFLYDTKRKNDKTAYEAGLMHNLGKNLALGLNFRYTDVKSNQSLYEYKKYTIKTNLYYSF